MTKPASTPVEPAAEEGQQSIKSVITQEHRTDWMIKLSRVARHTGEHVLAMTKSTIFDTVEVSSHQFSTVDGEGSNRLRSAIAEEFGTDFPGTVLEESDISRTLLDTKNIVYPIIIGDAVEGSTNAKRGLASFLPRPIQAGTSVVILENERLTSIAASAFFDFASGRVFSSVRVEAGSFMSFVDGQLIPQTEVNQCRGDSQFYVVVPGYSHRNVEDRAKIERALIDSGMCITGGSRSSALDMVDILCNQADAYVDLRALFPDSTNSRDEHLHSWDIGGILPVLDGLGFCITNEHGQGWQCNKFYQPLALVVTRPSIASRVRDAIRCLPFVKPDKESNDQSILSLPPRHIGQ